MNINTALSFKTVNFAYAIIMGRDNTYELILDRIESAKSGCHLSSYQKHEFNDIWDYEPGVAFFCDLLFDKKPVLCGAECIGANL